MHCPAPKKRYLADPPKMQAIWSSAAATDSHPPIISQVEPGLAATSGTIMRRRLFGDFLGRHPRSQFDQLERARMIVAPEHRAIGADPVYEILSGPLTRSFRDADRKRGAAGKEWAAVVDAGG